MAICGKVPAFREADRKITELAERAYSKRKRAANAYRHRAIVWGVQSHFYMDFLVWLLNCWGIVPLTDMPVSYTHLDVYKRQTLYGICLRVSTHKKIYSQFLCRFFVTCFKNAPDSLTLQG